MTNVLDAMASVTENIEMFTASGRWPEPPEASSHEGTRLNREQVISRIMGMNPTARAEFLEEFGDYELRTYMNHLQSAREPRGRFARWERPGDAPSIMSRSRDD